MDGRPLRTGQSGGRRALDMVATCTSSPAQGWGGAPMKGPRCNVAQDRLGMEGTPTWGRTRRGPVSRRLTAAASSPLQSNWWWLAPADVRPRQGVGWH
jgi:hypothetical protein